MMAAQQAGLRDTCQYLSGANERAGGHGLEASRAHRFQYAGQVRGHCARHRPSAGERDGQQHHCAVDRECPVWRQPLLLQPRARPAE